MDPFLLGIYLIVGLNLAGFLFGYFLQTDKLTDLVYNLTFFLLAVLVLWNAGAITWDRIVLSMMIIIWSIRLGTYLFLRVLKMKKDDRFDQFRSSFVGFGKFWLLQTVSIFIIALPFLFYLENEAPIELGFISGFGFAIWLSGFVIESVADYQKSVFRNDPKNEGQFIQSGLWRISQHPNYLGEIMCWIGVFLFCVPALQGWEWIAVISPIWIFILLRYISGIPLYRKKGKSGMGIWWNIGSIVM